MQHHSKILLEQSFIFENKLFSRQIFDSGDHPLN